MKEEGHATVRDSANSWADAYAKESPRGAKPNVKEAVRSCEILILTC